VNVVSSKCPDSREGKRKAMQCEKCKRGGYDRNDVKVDPVNRIFVGPCCPINDRPVAVSEVVEEPNVEYGVEFSSSTGLLAYVNYGDLTLQYHKPPQEIRQWFQDFQIQQ